MKNLVSTIAILILSTSINAQTFAWANKHGGTGNEMCKDVATDAAGNVYRTGYFSGTVDFDPGAGVANLVSLGGQDAFVSKLDAAGNYVWAVRYGSTGNEEANGIALDASGNIHITGGFYGTVDFDPGPGSAILGNGTGSDIYVLKLTNSAGFVWVKQFGGTNDNQVGNKIAVDAAGNVYSTGQSIGVIDFDPGAGTVNLGVAFSGNTNFYVSKLNISGNYVWARCIGNANSSCYGMDIQVSTAQEVYTCGYFIATSLDFDPGAGTVSMSTGSAYDGFVHKFTSAGLYSWVRRIGGGSTSPDACYGLHLTSNRIYTTGYFYGTADLDPGAGVVNHTSAGLTDVFVHAMDYNGIYQWSRQIGGVSDDYGYAIATDAMGGIYSTGFVTGTADFDPGPGTATLTGFGLRDAYISKLTSAGLYDWGFQLGGTAIETGYGIAVAPSGDVYTAGYYAGTGDYDPTAGTFNLSTAGGNDVFIQKMAQCLTPVAPTNTTAPAAMTICYNSSTTLTASGFGTYGWYSASSGGTYLGGGSSFVTPNLTTNTTYYVQDSLCAAGTRTAITVTVGSQITSSISSSTNVACNGGNNGTATVLPAGGTSPYTYAWAPSGGTAATATGLPAATYTCTITDVAGCTATQTVSITQPTAITSSVSSQTGVSCNGGSNGSATILAGGGTPGYTYVWAPSGGTAATATGLIANTYTCTITDANSCTRTQTVSITQPTAITSSVSSQTGVSCNGGSNGSATILAGGGTPGYTYLWAPSGGTAATATGLSATTYTCTITDANSCTRTQTVSITQPTAITTSVSSQTNVLCNGGNTGAATVAVSGGTPGYTYLWTPSGGTAAAATGLAIGVYTCTITDANSCTQTQTVNITEPIVLAAAISAQLDPLCNGGSDGTASVTASGGTGILSYMWSPAGGTASTAAGIGAGTYSCTVTDANGCSITTIATLTEPTAITTSVVSQSDPFCNAGTDGAADISATGGTGAFTYFWSPTGGTAATATGLNAGTYSCVVTDANSCTATQTVVLSEPAAIASSQTVTLCAGQTHTVGASTYTVTGIYNEVLTALNGCDSTVTTDLTINNAIDVTTTVVGNTASSNQNGATYQWIDCLNGNAPLPGETNQSLTPAVSGDYAVIVTVGACSDTSACTNVITGIESNENVVFNLYPNPTNGVVTIQLNQFSSNAQIEVFNATGQLVSTETLMSNLVTIILPEDNGIYLVRVTIDGVSSTKRVLRQ